MTGSFVAEQSIGDGKYVLRKRLGSGGQAEVWEAIAHGIGGFQQTVVIKALHADKRAPEIRKQLVREAQMAATLNHANIVQIFDIGEHDGQPFLVMEFFPGVDLSSVLKHLQSKGLQTMPWEIAVWVVRDICQALQYAHNLTSPDGGPLRIVHRDIKPHNILLNEQGYAKLIDFGVARQTHSPSLTKTGSIKGTPAYMSPEQIQDEDLDHRTDLFSVGVTLFELCSGRRPFLQEDLFVLMYAIVHKTYPSLRELHPKLPAPLYDIVERLLQKDANARYQHAKDVVLALEELLRTHAPQLDRPRLQAMLAPILSVDTDVEECRELDKKAALRGSKEDTQSISAEPSPLAYAETMTGDALSLMQQRRSDTTELRPSAVKRHSGQPSGPRRRSVRQRLPADVSTEVDRLLSTSTSDALFKSFSSPILPLLIGAACLGLFAMGGQLYWYWQSQKPPPPIILPGKTPRKRPKPNVTRGSQVRVKRRVPNRRSTVTLPLRKPSSLPVVVRKPIVGVAKIWVTPPCQLFDGGTKLGLANGLVVTRPIGVRHFQCISPKRALRVKLSISFRAERETTLRRKIPMGSLVVRSVVKASVFLPPFGLLGSSRALLSLRAGTHTIVLQKLDDKTQRKSLVVRVLPGRTTRTPLIRW